MYVSLEERSSMAGLPVVDSGDALIGIYINASGVAVLFSSSGFRVGRLGGEWGGLTRYSDLRSAVVVREKDPYRIVLHCDDGRSVAVPVDHTSDGKFLESLQVLRFFDRVIGDLRCKNETSS